ncbi:MAG TPA: type II secretion system protein [Patescibacteria group bacterium]|jgi:prepilin-type N-terminal cleavage/methylation domain-containing protein|nr:type II secretion system protein [Patescibacteria group bacterium]
MLKKNKSGFTIIEVLIVLAIAGLIMLIVFLAVPALQRNSRNTQRKNDIASLLSAVSEYSTNHSGTYPGGGNFSTVFTDTNPNLGYYTTAGNVTWAKQNGPTPVTDPASLDSVKLANYAKCSGNSSVAAGATSRSVVAVYDVEGSGGAIVPQCLEE